MSVSVSSSIVLVFVVVFVLLLLSREDDDSTNDASFSICTIFEICCVCVVFVAVVVVDANDESMGGSSGDRNKAGCEDGTGRNADIENGDTSTSTIAIHVSSRSTNVIDTDVNDDVE